MPREINNFYISPEVYISFDNILFTNGTQLANFDPLQKAVLMEMVPAILQCIGLLGFLILLYANGTNILILMNLNL